MTHLENLPQEPDFLADYDHEEQLAMMLAIVREHRDTTNCRRYPQTVATWLMINSHTVEGARKRVLQADRLVRDNSDYDGPGLSDPKQECERVGDNWSGALIVHVYMPRGFTDYRTISEW